MNSSFNVNPRSPLCCDCKELRNDRKTKDPRKDRPNEHAGLTTVVSPISNPARDIKAAAAESSRFTNWPEWH
jgi:hypothetical protein